MIIFSRFIFFMVKFVDFGLKRIINEKGCWILNFVKIVWIVLEVYKFRKGEDLVWFYFRKVDVYSFVIMCFEIFIGDYFFVYFNVDYNFDVVKDGDWLRLLGEIFR